MKKFLASLVLVVSLVALTAPAFAALGVPKVFNDICGVIDPHRDEGMEISMKVFGLHGEMCIRDAAKEQCEQIVE